VILEVFHTESTPSHELRQRVTEILVAAGERPVLTVEDFQAILTSRDKLRAEVASLRLTLGGRTFGPSTPEPIGCPAPGACAQVAEIDRLRRAVKTAEDALREAGYPAAADGMKAILMGEQR